MRPRPLPSILQVDWGLGRPAGVLGSDAASGWTGPGDLARSVTSSEPGAVESGQCPCPFPQWGCSSQGHIPPLARPGWGSLDTRCLARVGGRGCRKPPQSAGPASEAGPPHMDPWSWERPVQVRWRVE